MDKNNGKCSRTIARKNYLCTLTKINRFKKLKVWRCLSVENDPLETDDKMSDNSGWNLTISWGVRGYYWAGSPPIKSCILWFLRFPSSPARWDWKVKIETNPECRRPSPCEAIEPEKLELVLRSAQYVCFCWWGVRWVSCRVESLMPSLGLVGRWEL